jgi:hypothetical protein
MPHHDIEMEVVSLHAQHQKARITAMERMRDDTNSLRIMLKKLEAQARCVSKRKIFGNGSAHSQS